MCRLYGFRANEPTKVECPLILAQNALLLQSRADRAGTSHPDGWGIGYYLNGRPEVCRRDVAAFRDAHFSTTAGRIYASTVVAHVRLATVGGTTVANAHPFTHGRWLFAHNGTVAAFETVRRRLESETRDDLRTAGTTDSEILFHWLLSRLETAGVDLAAGMTEVPRLRALVADAVRTVDGWCRGVRASKPARLNLLLTDGRSLVATRFNRTLHWVARDGIGSCEVCGVPHVHHTRGAHYRAVDIASEPLTHEPWHELPDHSVLSVDAAVDTVIEPI